MTYNESVQEALEESADIVDIDCRADPGSDEVDDPDEEALRTLMRHRGRAARRRDSRARPSRRPVVPPTIVEQLDDSYDAFVPSHACSENEETLLRDTLGVFYRQNVITDVVARVKGGKEANVYCCSAHPSTGLELIAAKVYRPRAHRTMRNDAIYREGRLVLDEEGKGVVRDARIARAMAKKTAFGLELATFGWIEHEYGVMAALYADGADVPRPIGHVGSAILMEYLGDVNRPAPTMDGVRLGSRRVAQATYERLIWHVELMLRHNWVHGDLSAFNVLWWQGRGVLIDFPQAVVATANRNAEWLLRRDLERVCAYFRRYGIESDAAALADELWSKFMNAAWFA